MCFLVGGLNGAFSYTRYLAGLHMQVHGTVVALLQNFADCSCFGGSLRAFHFHTCVGV